MTHNIKATETIRIHNKDGAITATGQQWLDKWKSAPPTTKTPLELAEANLQELVDYFTINGPDYCSKYGDGAFGNFHLSKDAMAALKQLDSLVAVAPRAGFKVTLAEAAATEADDAD